MAWACNESLGMVRKKSPSSGNSSSASAEAVGPQVSTPASTDAVRVLRVLVDDVGPMMASTPSCVRPCTASAAVAGVSPSSRTISRTRRPLMPPAALISVMPIVSASFIEAPRSAARPLLGRMAPITNAPSSGCTVVLVATTVSLDAGPAVLSSLHAAGRMMASSPTRPVTERDCTGRV